MISTLIIIYLLTSGISPSPESVKQNFIDIVLSVNNTEEILENDNPDIKLRTEIKSECQGEFGTRKIINTYRGDTRILSIIVIYDESGLVEQIINTVLIEDHRALIITGTTELIDNIHVHSREEYFIGLINFRFVEGPIQRIIISRDDTKYLELFDVHKNFLIPCPIKEINNTKDEFFQSE